MQYLVSTAKIPPLPISVPATCTAEDRAGLQIQAEACGTWLFEDKPLGWMSTEKIRG